MSLSKNSVALLLGASGPILAVCIVPFAAQAGSPLPTGGKFAAGSGNVTGSAAGLTVDQTSKAGIVDWQSFSIGARDSVQFNNGSGATLNEVTSNNLSTIAGSLKATGSVYLVNPSGVVITSTGRVVAGGSFAASTQSIDHNGFLGGQISYASGAHGNVANAGSISANGSASLNGNNIANTGSITVNGGHIWLNAANTASIGGAVNAGGTPFGSIDVQARNIAVTGQLSASGAGGGGSIAIGGWSANSVSVGKAATLNASATGAGNGGTISVIAQKNSFAGSAEARGGALSGNGGTIETSGRLLSFAGARVDAGATSGRSGTWLLDPDNLDIYAPNATVIDNALNSGTNLTLETTATGCVGKGSCVPGVGDIDIFSALAWDTTATLSIEAYHSINVSAPITISGAGGLVLDYNSEGTDGGLNFSTLIGGTGAVAFTDLAGGMPQGSLTINGTPYMLIGSMTALQAINDNLGGNYALAESLNASGVSWSPLGGFVGGSYFSGIFEGLGNTVSNLSVDVNGYAGLFGQLNGTIRDVGVVNAYDNGAYPGLLAGLLESGDASIVNSWATGTVSGDYLAGGLVAQSYGNIINSWANASVSGQYYIGGLVGGAFGGTIQNSWSAGSVYAGTQYGGGLAGQDEANVTNSYSVASVSGGQDIGGLFGTLQYASISNDLSMGYVSGGSAVGGLVGALGPYGSVSNSYWDMQTSGQSTDGGGATGLTTAQLQAALPSGFSASTWSIVAGESYPYLSWQFAGTPQIVSGTAFESDGKTPVAAQAIGMLLNGSSVTPALAMNSGADGYYYMLLQPGTLGTKANQVLIYLESGAAGNTFVNSAPTTLTGIDVGQGWLTAESSAVDSAGLLSALGTAIGSMTGSQFLYSGSAFTSGADVLLDEGSSAFKLDSTIDLGSGILAFDASGSVTQTAGQITAGALAGRSGGSASFHDANDIAALGSFSTGGDFLLVDATTLDVAGALEAGGGNIMLTTVGAGNGIGLAALLSGNSVTLASAGTIAESGSGSINADILSGSAKGAVSLGDANTIGSLAVFTTNGDGNFALTNAAALYVTGEVAAGTDSVSLKTTSGSLELDGSIDAGTVDLSSVKGEVLGGGVITASLLNVTASTGIDLTGDNDITKIGTHKTKSGPNVINNPQ